MKIMNALSMNANFLKTMPWWVAALYGAMLGTSFTFLNKINMLDTIQASVLYTLWMAINVTILSLWLVSWFCEYRKVAVSKLITLALILLSGMSLIYGIVLFGYCLYRAFFS